MKCPSCDTGVVINKCGNAWKPECNECGTLIDPIVFNEWRHGYSLRSTTDFPDYTVYKKGNEYQDDVFWCSEATLEDAKYRCAVEEWAYQDSTNYTFIYKNELWNRDDEGRSLI